jgi:glycosyltransferase involved in cell wall biosynthesis
MRIGIFSDTLEKKGTGIGYYTEHLLKYISDVAKENDTIYTIDWKKGANYKYHIEVSNPFPFFKEYLWHSYCVKKLKKSDFDILHNPSQIPIFLRPNIRYVVTIHDITTIVKGETHPLSHRLFDLIAMKKTFQYASGIIVDSIATREDIIRIFDIPSYRIEVIYLAADEAFCQISDDEVDNFRERYGIRDPFILFVGTIQPRKNITNLLRAFHLLKKKGYPHKLIIIGKKGWKYKEIFEQIE